MANSNPFSLIKEKRFGPLFFTQFFGAFNDNLYKSAIVIYFSIATKQGLINDEKGLLVTLAAGILILPFFLFSSIAGQLADKYDKATVLKNTKNAEIFIMGLVGLGFYFQSPTFLLSILFLTGTQSTFFGPAKYSILPQCLPTRHELVRGNALIEMGTFVSILIGGIIGSVLAATQPYGNIYATITVFVVAILGWTSSRFIPPAPPSTNNNVELNWNLFSESRRIIQMSHKNPVVFLSILGISWFWFYGSVFVAQAINYNNHVLGGHEYIASLILALFSIGIGVGSILCERMCKNKIELGLVPLGAIGMTIFAAHLAFVEIPFPDHEITLQEFFMYRHNIIAAFDLVMIGTFGGFYTIPLYTIMQNRSHPSHRSRIIAANNIINSLFMVLSTILSIILLNYITVTQLFLVVAVLNALVSLYIYFLTPEFLLRFLAWMLVHTFYRVEHENLDKIPEKGAAVIASNHVSFVDPIILLASSPRPIKFVMDHNWYNVPGLKLIFKTMGAIPIASAKDNAEVKDQAFEKIAKCLENGEIVCIFPEGTITKTGDINQFRPGLHQIVRRNPVPIIPVALQGLWGSFFSRKYGRAMAHVPRKFLSKIGIKAGEELSADTPIEEIEKIVKELRGDWA